MEIYVPYTEPLKVAECLNSKHLNQQIIACKYIISSIKNNEHPVELLAKMYYNHWHWLKMFCMCLENYRDGNYKMAEIYSNSANLEKPDFINEELCFKHKMLLYKDDKVYYQNFKRYYNADSKWYFIDNKIIVE